MNAKELAKIIGVHPNTVYNMIKNGELKAEKKNKSYEVDESQAQKLITSKNILRAENNIHNGVDDVLIVLREKQRQNFLKILDQLSEFNDTVNENKYDSNNFLDLSKETSYNMLFRLMQEFDERNQIIWEIENLKEDYCPEEYKADLNSKFKELKSNKAKYSIEDMCAKASMSLINI